MSMQVVGARTSPRYINIHSKLKKHWNEMKVNRHDVWPKLKNSSGLIRRLVGECWAECQRQ